MAKTMAKIKNAEAEKATKDVTETLERSEVFKVPVDQIFEDPKFQNSRHNPEGLAELQESLLELGQKTPIELRKGKDGKLYIQAGFRRMNAIHNIRVSDPTLFQTVDATIFEGSYEDAMLHNLVENVQREDLTPLEIGEYLCAIQDKFSKSGEKITGKELAGMIGKSETYVSRAMAIFKDKDDAKMTPSLKRLINEKKVPFWTAVKIAEHSPKKQLEICDTIEKAFRKSKEDGEEAVKKAKKESVRDFRTKQEINEMFAVFTGKDLDQQMEAFDVVWNKWMEDPTPEELETLRLAFAYVSMCGTLKALTWVKNNNVDWERLTPPFLIEDVLADVGKDLKKEEEEEEEPPKAKKKAKGKVKASKVDPTEEDEDEEPSKDIFEDMDETEA